MKRFIPLLVFVFSLSFSSCRKAQEEPLVEFETDCGNFTIRLFKETPKHRDNFIQLVDDGFYDGLLIHRVEKGYMMQTGDPNSKDANMNRRLGMGGTGYYIDAEIDSSVNSGNSSSVLFNKRGAVTAARLPDHINPSKQSNGSQFYIIVGNVFSDAGLDSLEQADRDSRLDIIWQKLIMANRSKIEECGRRKDSVERLHFLQDSLTQIAGALISQQKSLKFSDLQRKAYTSVGGVPALDGEYTVFGEVVKGMDVVMKINSVPVNSIFRPVKDVRIIKAKVLKD